jgi:hypothetical protein
MNRRSFLASVATALVGVAVDPELLAWRPGAKSYHFAPRVRLAEPGLSIRFTREWAALRNTQVRRIDVRYGWAVLRPDLAVRVACPEPEVEHLQTVHPLAFHPLSFQLVTETL